VNTRKKRNRRRKVDPVPLRGELADILGQRPPRSKLQRVPSVVSGYKLLGEIGEGGTGTVFRARDRRLNRVVAIKMLRKQLSFDRQSRARLLREAKCAATLNHPNIVTVHHLCSEHGADFVVMEFVARKGLDRLIPRGGFRIKVFLDYALQMASAVAAVHSKGIAHRDLKPANFVLTKQGTIKLLDFSLAKEVRCQRRGRHKRPASPVTSEGTILGTIGYMSPEQAQAKRADERSDIFSLGAIFYEMLTGRRAFQETSPLDTMNATVKKNPRLPARVPPEIGNIIRRCLEKRPALRYKNASELTVALILAADLSWPNKP
jgi:serine/threonine protein kinase